MAEPAVELSFLLKLCSTHSHFCPLINASISLLDVAGPDYADDMTNIVKSSNNSGSHFSYTDFK